MFFSRVDPAQVCSLQKLPDSKILQYTGVKMISEGPGLMGCAAVLIHLLAVPEEGRCTPSLIVELCCPPKS